MENLLPHEAIPSLMPLEECVMDYIEKHQGEKGYIDCQPSLNGDIIFGIVFDDFSGTGIEKYVYGVRVKNDDIEVLLVDITHTYTETYSDEDFKLDEDKWLSIKWSDVYYIPTLFNIAENIEEYGE